MLTIHTLTGHFVDRKVILAGSFSSPSKVTEAISQIRMERKMIEDMGYWSTTSTDPENANTRVTVVYKGSRNHPEGSIDVATFISVVSHIDDLMSHEICS